MKKLSWLIAAAVITIVLAVYLVWLSFYGSGTLPL